MIRPAKFFDIVRIIELLDEMHDVSIYRDRTEIDYKAAHRLMAQAIQRHGFTNDGGACVIVSVRDQKVEGFFVGMLDRVYHIGTKLRANDLFFYCSPRCHPSDATNMFRTYVEWASNNPKVIEIMASWTDTLYGAERVEALYSATGFRPCGGIWSRDVVHPEPVQLVVLEGVE
jgi:hypothetical protein